MKILVTGATGFVGRAIVAESLAAGHSVRALVRSPHSTAVQSFARNGIDLARGDILEPALLAPAVAGCEGVIHLVRIIREAGRSTFERIHTEGTRNVIAAAQRAGVRRYVQMSALGARPDAVARYHQTKWAAEEIVRASGLAWTIFRPSIIYGPGDGFVNLFARLSCFSPILPVMGSGRNKMQPVAVAAVAQAFVRSLAEPKSEHQTFDLCGGEVFAFNEILDAILAVTGRRRLKLHWPMPLARALAATLEMICPRVLRRPPPLNRDQLLMLQEDNTGDGRAATELFGLKHPGFREGIARYLV